MLTTKQFPSTPPPMLTAPTFTISLSSFFCVSEINSIFFVRGRLRKVPGNVGLPVSVYPFIRVVSTLKVYNINTPGLAMIDIFQYEPILACHLFLILIQRCIFFLQGWFVAFFLSLSASQTLPPLEFPIQLSFTHFFHLLGDTTSS